MRLLALTKIFTPLILLLFVSPVLAQEVELVKKTDNFCLFLDQSSSMKWDYEDQGMKIALAKKILADINRRIPELDYNGGLYTFAHYSELLPFKSYNQREMATAIDGIDTEYSGLFSLRNTPIGWGLEDLQPALSTLRGRIDLILITDGGQNIGTDPVRIAGSMAREYGDRLCIHVVSLAQSPAEQSVTTALSQITPDCSVSVTAADLLSEKELEKFVEDVFFERRTVSAPAPAEPEEPVEEPVVEEPTEPAPVPEEKPAMEPEIIALQRVHFDFDKSFIKPEYVPVLNCAVSVLEDNPDVEVLIQGHTCSTGTEEYNQGLSERRAQSVKNYLVKHGIAPERLETIGYGESRPRHDNSTPEGRAKNRRVELNVKH